MTARLRRWAPRLVLGLLAGLLAMHAAPGAGATAQVPGAVQKTAMGGSAHGPGHERRTPECN